MSQERAGSRAAERHHELRRDQAQLLIEPPVTGFDFTRARLDVQSPLAARLELEMLYGIGDVDRVAPEPRILQRPIENRARGPHERMPLPIFGIPWSLAYQHEP